MLKENRKSTEMLVELAGCLLQILTDHKCTLNEMGTYRVFVRLIEIVREKISGEKIVEILLKKSKMVRALLEQLKSFKFRLNCYLPHFLKASFHDMAVQALIVNTITGNRTESAFITDVESVIERLALGAAAYASDLICQHFHRQISSGFIMCEKEPLEKLDESVSNMVYRTSEQQLQMLEIFQEFLAAVAKFLSKFNSLSLEFHQNEKAKEELIEQLIAFVRTASLNCTIDLKLKILDVILATVIAGKSKNDKILLTGQLNKLNEANRCDDVSMRIRNHLVRILLKLPVSEKKHALN